MRGMVFRFVFVFTLILAATGKNAFSYEGTPITYYEKVYVCDGTYSVVYSEGDYYILDYDNLCIGEGKGDFIKEIFEFRNEVYMVNIKGERESQEWQLVKLNLNYYGIDTDKIEQEIIADDCYAIFNTFSKGIIEVRNIEEEKYVIEYKDDCGNMKTLKVDMDEFKDYGGFRNLRDVDIRDGYVFFLTLGGELVRYDVQQEEFKLLKKEFVINLRRAIES